MNPEDIDKYKSKGFLGGLLLGFTIFFVLFAFAIGGSFVDFAYFLGHKDEYDKSNIDFKKSFENYALSNSENVKSFLLNSEERQKELVSILYNLQIESSKKSIIMSITNREIDKLRIVTTLNSYALTEFRKNDFKSIDQTIINDVYKATGLILDNKFQESANLLTKTYGEIESPDDNIKIEILRYLTFSFFALNDKNNAKYWLNKAKELKNGSKNGLEWSTYTESYFWVDLLDFWISIQENNTLNANQVFNSLTKNANPEFLESKFIQHELNLSSDDKKKWNEYLNKLRKK